MKQEERDIRKQPGEIERFRRRITELETVVSEYQRMEIALKESGERFRAILEGIGDSIVIIERDMKITWANSFAVEQHGELVGRHCYEGIKDRGKVCLCCNARETFKDGVIRRFEEIIAVQGDEARYVLVTVSPIVNTKRDIVAVVETFKDITDRKKAEKKLQRSLEEKEILLREIHHRVKNNMQTISGMLTLQEIQANDEIVSKVFADSKKRIQTMALIHEMLYETNSLAKIELGSYLTRLIDAVYSALTEGSPIKVKIVSDDIQIATDQVVPCALAVNEIISNSLEHAFPDGRSGEIRVEARLLKNNEVEVSICDNGTGMPHDFDWRNANTLGLKLVNSLIVDQLGGTLKKGGENGTRFTFRFKRGIGATH